MLRNVRLIEELRASRRRLVAAQDDERRRLERNIHDGAQQQLVALSIKLGLAESLVDGDPDKARELMSSLRAESAEALENLRDLARGIYPPLLADQGLASALTVQARKSPAPVTVESDGIGRYRQDVEPVEPSGSRAGQGLEPPSPAECQQVSRPQAWDPERELVKASGTR